MAPTGDLMDVPFYTAAYDFRLARADGRRREPSGASVGRTGRQFAPDCEGRRSWPGASSTSPFLAGGHRLDPPRFRARDRVSRPPPDGGRRVPVLSGLTPADLPGGEGWAIERLRIVTHNGTHLDAPYHFHSTNRGERAITIDEVPLEWCFNPGVKLDFATSPTATSRPRPTSRRSCSASATTSPLDIVVVNTAAGAAYGRPTTSPRAAAWAARRPVPPGARRARDRHRRLELGCALHPHQGALRPNRRCRPDLGGHRAGMEIGYCHLEKLHNLEALPATGFQVCCFPFNIKARRPASPARSRSSRHDRGSTG